MASTARAFVLSRFGDLYLTHRQRLQSPLAFSHRVSGAKPSSVLLSLRRPRSPAVCGKVLCLVSGVDNGGVSDEFVSTRRSRLDRGFAVIANLLKQIEPLDMSVISQGVSDSAKDSMKETISTMLGLLPSDQFSVTVNVSRGPLVRLLVSSIITGYTLWNAEYRVMLMKNFDIPMEDSDKLNQEKRVGDSVTEVSDGESGFGTKIDELETSDPQVLGNISPQVTNYIQKLQLELSQAKEELNARKRENKDIESDRGHRNDLLDYLRALDSYMVRDLSKPSSPEVGEIVHQLVLDISRSLFKNDAESNSNDNDEPLKTIDADRDFLAKLLFWCMLLGHHLRGLENRLHLSCVVGLL